MPGPGHRWAKGQSGNPSGRPAGAEKLARLLAAETDNGREIVKFMLTTARGKDRRLKSEGSIRWAREWVMDRIYGKARQTLDLNLEPPDQTRLNPALLSDEQSRMWNQLVAVMTGQQIESEDDPLALPAPAIDVPSDG